MIKEDITINTPNRFKEITIPIGTKVNTPNGIGTIKNYETYPTWDFFRYGIVLENNPFDFLPYYVNKEIKKCI